MLATATSSTPYQLHSNGQENMIEHRNHLSQLFSWLDTSMYYVPMYTSLLPSGKRRSFICSILSILFIILFSIGLSVVLLYNLFHSLIKHPSYKILAANGCAQSILLLISRILMLYYCYFKFNYPYHSSLPKFNDTDSNSNSYSVTMDQRNISNKHTQKKYVQIIQVLILLLITIQIIDVTVVAIEPGKVYNYQYDSWNYVISGIFYILVNQIPFALLLAIHGAICLKYQYYMKQLVIILKSAMESAEDIDMKDFADKYKILKDNYKMDYGVLIEYVIKIYVFVQAVLAWVWWYIFESTLHPIHLVEILTLIIAWLLYVIPAAFMNEGYEEFCDELWQYGDSKVMKEDKEEDMKDKYYYNHLTQYVKEFPITMEMSGFLITKRNSITFVIAFVVSQYLAWLLSDVGVEG